MDAGVRHQVGLELVQVDVEGAVETERGGDGGDNCSERSGYILKISYHIQGVDLP